MSERKLRATVTIPARDYDAITEKVGAHWHIGPVLRLYPSDPLAWPSQAEFDLTVVRGE